MKTVPALLILLATLLQDKEAEALFKAMKEKIENAKTLRLEYTVTVGEAGRAFATFQSSVKLKGNRWTMELKLDEGPRPRSVRQRLLCDGRKVIAEGEAEGVSPDSLKPEVVATEIRQGAHLSMAGQLLSMMFQSPDRRGEAAPEVGPVTLAGKEKLGDREAQILEYTLKYNRPELENQVLSVKLWVDVAGKRPLKREINFRGQVCSEVFSTFALDEEIPDSEFSFQSKSRLAQALAGQVADSVRLFSRYTGRHPKSPEDLVRRPPALEPEIFWPEGGFCLGGALPKDPWGRPFEFRTEAGELRILSLGAEGASASVPPATRRPVGAPTERLQKYFTARVRLQLLGSAVRAFRAAYGELPRQEAAFWNKPDWAEVWPDGGWVAGEGLPGDPWGDPFLVVPEKGFVRIQVRDPKGRALSFRSLHPDEARRLEEIAQPRLTPDEKKEIAALLEAMGDDDLETREKALAGLKAWGPAAIPLLDERAKLEKDSEARGRLRTARNEIPAPPAAYRAELGPLTLTVSGGSGRGTVSQSAHERNASASLKTIATAEADFRANDRDGNHVNDFWVGDVAGLYSLKVEGQPIKLIEVAVALADGAPLKVGAAGGRIPALTDLGEPGPKAGYYFRVMTHDNSSGKSEPYATEINADDKMGKVHNAASFGFCSYPAEYGVTGTRTFIINEGNTIFWKDTAGEPALEWPSDEELQAEWHKLD